MLREKFEKIIDGIIESNDALVDVEKSEWIEEREDENTLYVVNTNAEMDLLIKEYEKITGLGYMYSDNVDIVFSDELMMCYECYKMGYTKEIHLVPDGTSANSYCEKCLRENHESEYFEGLNRNINIANRIYSHEELLTKGFIRWDVDFSYGMYGGVNRKPDEALRLFDENVTGDFQVVFSIDDVNPYNTDYSIYYRILN